MTLNNSNYGVQIHPVAVFSILDHFMRRPLQQDRVIGALLGIRNSETDVQINSSFAVPHSENEEQATVDSEHLQSMLDLHLKVNPKENVVGWYATGSTLNAYSALIQNFFTQQNTQPFNAIHLTIDTSIKDFDKSVRAYIGSSLGPTPKLDNCVFQPISHSLLIRQNERPGFEVLSSIDKSPKEDSKALDSALENINEMIDKLLSYVQDVNSGKVQGDPVIGASLMNVLQSINDRSDKNNLQSIFNNHLQDTFQLSHLASLISNQAEISSKLNLIQ